MAKKKRVYRNQPLDERKISKQGSNSEELAILPKLVLVVIFACALDLWLEHVAVYWALLGAVFWITVLYARQQKTHGLEKQSQQLASHLKMQMLANQPVTAKEPTEWLSKLVLKLWPNVLEPRVMLQLQLLAERNMRSHKPRSIRGVDVQNFSLGNAAPEIGLGRTYWSTDPNGQEVLHTGIKWDSNDLTVQLALHLGGSQRGQTAHVVISSVHIQGDVRILPILDGQGLLYAFESLPEVDMSVALAPGSQRLPFDLPGIKSWLEQVMSESLNLAMVEPGYNLWTLVPVNLNKTCIGGILTVTVESGSDLTRSNDAAAVGSGQSDAASSEIQGGESSEAGGRVGTTVEAAVESTFVEISFEEMTRQTQVSLGRGASPRWGDLLNLVMHDSEGLLQLSVYEQREDGVTCDFLGSCEVKVKYGEDDSAFFWAVGSRGGGVVAGRAEKRGSCVRLTVPLQHSAGGSITISVALQEWFFAQEGGRPAPAVASAEALRARTAQLWPPMRVLTGRTLRVTAVEGRGLQEEGTTTRPNLCLQLHYGKNVRKTRPRHDPNPVWNEEFEFAEVVGSEQLRLSCWDARPWGHKSRGTARISMQGIPEGSPKELKLPLEKASTGEVHLRVEIVRKDEKARDPAEPPRVSQKAIVPVPVSVSAGPQPILSCFGTQYLSATAQNEEFIGRGPIEKLHLAVLEARNLRSADRSERLDPYVSIRYGTQKRKTKVVHRSANPQWQQEFEFPLILEPLVLHIKDHRSLVPSQFIGHVELDPAGSPLNQTEDRWIALKEVGGGEIHLRITRKGPGEPPAVPVETKSLIPSEAAAATAIGRLQRTSQKLRLLLREALELAEDGEESAEVQRMVDEVVRHEDERESLIAQLQQDRDLLFSKIKQLEYAMLRNT